MKRIYVAGAYSADNVLDVLINIGKGEIMAAELFHLGFAPFCPWHDKDYIIKFPEKQYTVDMFYGYSMAWLEVSDAILVLPGWTESKGTHAEIHRAHELGIEVFWSVDNLIKWRDRNELL